MIKATQKDMPRIMSYLEQDLANCLYMYGDLEVYGLEDPNISLWYSEKDGELNAVVFKYFQGSHVFSLKRDCDLDEVADHLVEINVDRVCSDGDTIRALHERLSDRFTAEYGRTLRLDSYREFKPDVEIEEATIEDVDKIVDLMMSHPLYSESYSADQLKEELTDRIGRGIGRSFIIRNGDRIIAHDSFNLETDKYAIAGLALVHDDFRKTFYGVYLESHMVNQILRENKVLYAMLFDMKRVAGFIRMGNTDVGEYGKMNRIAR